MRAWILLLLGVASAIWAQNPDNLLARANQKVMETIDRLPRYVCTLTTNRGDYDAGVRHRESSCDNLIAARKAPQWRRRMTASDRLRVDVSVGESNEVFGKGNEIYSWSNDRRFNDGGLFGLIRQGPLSTGSFWSSLAAIFGDNSIGSSYNRDTTIDGQRLSEFKFRVPLEKSSYRVVLGPGRNESLATPYDGTFLIDPKTADLVRLTTRTAQLPEDTGICEVNQVLDYGRVSLNGSSFLLPRETLLSVINHDGTEVENRAVYAACHEFRGSSTVSFDTIDPTSELQAPDKSALKLNPAVKDRLPFRMTFSDSIDASVAAAGDTITAKLTTEIRDRSSVFVPPGATITVRIVRIERFWGPTEAQIVEGWIASGQRGSLVLAVRPESLSVGGTMRPFTAVPDLSRNPVRGPLLLRHPSDRPADVSQGRGTAVFEFHNVGQDFVIPAGLTSNWLTLIL